MQLKSVSLISSLVKTIVAKNGYNLTLTFLQGQIHRQFLHCFLGEVKDFKIPHEINIPFNQTKIVKRQLTFGPRSEL